jgi:hypothetical protein
MHSFECIMSSILTFSIPFAFFTVSRISLVKPTKAKQIQELLIRMAQSGQVRQKVTEQQLIGLLDQVEGQGQAGSGGGSGAGKITVSDRDKDQRSTQYPHRRFWRLSSTRERKH